MRKLLLVMAIVVALAAMALCIQKSTTTMEKTIDKPRFTVGMPQGWAEKWMPNDDDAGLVRGDASDPEAAMEMPMVLVKVGQEEGMTLEAAHEGLAAAFQTAKSDDLTIGGTTFKTLNYKEGGRDALMLLAGNPAEALLVITVMNAQASDPDVQAIIGSVKLK